MILPGSTIGIFGSGQLGRMFAIEARKMGYRVHTFSPDTDTPTGQIADIETKADYNDLDEVKKFVQKVDVVTFEFENVPAETIQLAESFVQVHPKGEVLYTTQNRLREKDFLKKNGFPHAQFCHIQNLEDLKKAIEKLGVPCILKTAGFGYDGKGQTKINNQDQIEEAFKNLNGQEGILEAFVDFAKEVSVVCARNKNGEFVHYGVIENVHRNHILDISSAPSKISDEIYHEAIEIARQIADEFRYVGTLCIEFFLTKDNRLLVNEIAPRPHNSGHLTFDACVTSQFEQQLRAVCDLPFGSTEFYKPAAMANLLGDIWNLGKPNWEKALENPNVKLHLYGKSEARKGRKMGHLTALAKSAEEAISLVETARRKILENAFFSNQ
jgi:5-(carboxyamino)imidazole ribonucleotide synthase